MNTIDHLQLLFSSIVRQVPILAIEIIGLWFAFSRRVELGRASIFAVWGFSLLIAYAFSSVVIQYLLVVSRIGGATYTFGLDVAFLLGLWNLAAYLIFVCGLAALARAVFVGRNVSRDQGMDSQPR